MADKGVTVSTVEEKERAADALELGAALQRLGWAVNRIQRNADGDPSYMQTVTAGALLVAYDNRPGAVAEVDALADTAKAWLDLLYSDSFPLTLQDAVDG